MIEGYGILDYVIFVAAILLAFAIRSGAGFGGGVVLVPLLALTAPLPTVVPAASALNIISGLSQGFRNWRKVVWREMARILPFALTGVLIGVWALAMVDANLLSRLFGGFILLYALYMLKSGGRVPVISKRWLNPIMAFASFMGGFIGSVFGGAAGPIFAIYLAAIQTAKEGFRATMTMLMLILGGTRIITFITAGMYTPKVLTLLACGIPLVFVGGYIGTRIVQRLDQRHFNIGVGCVLLLSGVILMVR